MLRACLDCGEATDRDLCDDCRRALNAEMARGEYRRFASAQEAIAWLDDSEDE